MAGILHIALFTLVSVSAINAASYRRVCYHTNWSQYRNGQGKFYPENIDPHLCTHVIYAFAKIVNNHLTAFEWNDESTPWMKGMYERFNKMKQQNPTLKTSIAVGGWNMGSAPFTKMVATDATRRNFVLDAIKFLRKHNFDGLDIDWEYPANRGSPKGDRDKFTELLKLLKSEFEKEAQTSGKDQLILSAAIPAGKSNIDPGFNVPEISKYLDMMNLMTYDLHGGSWEDETGHNAPLHLSPQDHGNNTMLNVEWAAKYWVSKGAPKSKMNIGMPLYGRSFTLADPSDNGLYAPDRGNGGQAGRFTGESGFLAYYEICEMLKSGGTRHYLPDAMVPYLVKGSQWVGYDDPDSLRKKVDFVKQEGFGGAMVWALDLDDFRGSCGQGKYPLLKAINDELQNSSVPAPQPTKVTGLTDNHSSSGSSPMVKATTMSPTSAPSSSSTGYRRVCYHTNWSQYRNGKGKFYPENIDPTLCTHVIYAFAKIVNNHLTAFEWNDESTPWMKGMYERFNKLKNQNPSLKTSLAVGGWNMGSAPFTRMVATDATRRNFATDAVKFLRKHNFDGLDLDWEYPANRGSPKGDKDKYTELVKLLNAEFKKEAQTSGKDQLILSAAIPAGKSNIDPGYNVPEISKYLDMMNLMTYDLHGGSWEDETGHNAPLHLSPQDHGNNTMLNVEWAAKYWVQKGAPKSKLNIGMPLYGRSFTLADPSDNGLYAPDRGNGGQAGIFTGEAGFLAYYEICDMLKSGGTRHYLKDAMVPYLVKGSQWVGYDDPESLKKKVDFVKQEGYGGAMVWALDLDDFSGSCGQGKYPLLRAINDELQNSSVPTPQMTSDTSVASTSTTSGAVPLIQTTAVTAASSPPSPCGQKANRKAKRRVCYYANWTQYRHKPAKFVPENIDPQLCSHVIYAFAKLTNNHLTAFEWNDESTPGAKGMYQRVIDLKKQNPSLKVSLAVGGWKMGSADFTRMVATDATRRDFATNTVKFLRDHGFDGLDIDWEYPTKRGSPAGDKAKFVELMKVLDDEFKKEAQSSGKEKLLLSLAVPSGKKNIDPGYDIPQASKYVDMFNLMTYDLHGGSWETFVGNNAPLYQSPLDHGDNVNLNVAWAANYWAQQGAPKSKINVGMPLYGRTYTLADPNKNELYAPDKGNAGKAGPYTKEAGILAYYELCNMEKNGATRHFLPKAKVPYLVNGNQWISYDDQESLRAKADFVNNEDFGGIMIWSLDLDDFTGSICGQGKYPLLSAINDELNRAGSENDTGCVSQTTKSQTSESSAQSTSAEPQTTSRTSSSLPSTPSPPIMSTQAKSSAQPTPSPPPMMSTQTKSSAKPSPQPMMLTQAKSSAQPTPSPPPIVSTQAASQPTPSPPSMMSTKATTTAQPTPSPPKMISTQAKSTAQPTPSPPPMMSTQTKSTAQPTPSPPPQVISTQAKSSAQPTPSPPPMVSTQGSSTAQPTPSPQPMMSTQTKSTAQPKPSPQPQMISTQAKSSTQPTPTPPPMMSTQASASAQPTPSPPQMISTQAKSSARPTPTPPPMVSTQASASAQPTPTPPPMMSTQASASAQPTPTPPPMMSTQATSSAQPTPSPPPMVSTQAISSAQTTPSPPLMMSTQATSSSQPTPSLPPMMSTQATSSTQAKSSAQPTPSPQPTMQTQSTTSSPQPTSSQKPTKPQPTPSTPQPTPSTQSTQSSTIAKTTGKPQVTSTPSQITTHHIGLTQKFDCTGKTSGFYANPDSCDSYFICAGSQSFEVDCAPGLKFNPQTKYCAMASQVPQCGGVSSSTIQQITTTTTVTTTTTTPMPTTTTPAPTTTTPVPTTTTAKPMTTKHTTHAHKPCEGKFRGIVRDPHDCNVFYICERGHGVKEHCPPGLAFNTAIHNCDYPSHVKGCHHYTG